MQYTLNSEYLQEDISSIVFSVIIDSDTDETFFTERDIDITVTIKELVSIKPRYIEKILISSDFCMKINLINYGGYGYAHILKNVIPLMKELNMTEKQINILIKENSKKVLSI